MLEQALLRHDETQSAAAHGSGNGQPGSSALANNWSVGGKTRHITLLCADASQGYLKRQGPLR